MSHTRPEKHLDPSYCIWFFTKNLQPRPFGLEMMLSPPISRCRYFSYLFLRGTIIQYHPLSSINPSHKSQRFWWYHPIAIGSHLQAPARPQHGPRCGLCRGGWRASWSAEGMGFSWWWLGRNPKFVGPIHMSSSFCSIFVGFDCFIPLWDNREVKIHNSQLFWLEQGIMFDPEKSLVSLAHIIEGPLDFLMQKQISHI